MAEQVAVMVAAAEVVAAEVVEQVEAAAEVVAAEGAAANSRSPPTLMFRARGFRCGCGKPRPGRAHGGLGNVYEANAAVLRRARSGTSEKLD